MQLSKSQWLEWRDHPVTLARNEAISERIEELKDSLIISSDPDYDRIVKGMVRAFNEVLEIKPDLSIEENSDD